MARQNSKTDERFTSAEELEALTDEQLALVLSKFEDLALSLSIALRDGSVAQNATLTADGDGGFAVRLSKADGGHVLSASDVGADITAVSCFVPQSGAISASAARVLAYAKASQVAHSIAEALGREIGTVSEPFVVGERTFSRADGTSFTSPASVGVAVGIRGAGSQIRAAQVESLAKGTVWGKPRVSQPAPNVRDQRFVSHPASDSLPSVGAGPDDIPF